MSVSMKMTGFRDLERALAKLPAGTAKGVARRTMKKELKPIADMANLFWPGATDAFKITSRLKASQRAPVKESRSVTNMFVGADYGPGGEPHAHLIEFGTGPRYTKNGAYRGSVAPNPMLQPSWDMNKGQLLEGLGKRMWAEIEKTQARRAAKAAKG